MEHETKRRDGETHSQVQLRVDNVGGITSAEVAVSDGVTLLSGRNASNKSSLLRALAGVLGGPTPPLKNDAETGGTHLRVGDAEYDLGLERRDGRTVVARSDVYASCDELCELFVALTESNPIRQAILAGDDLYDLLMRPVDTAAIRADIRRLRERKDDIDARLDELDAMADRLPGLRTRRDTLAERQTELESTLRAKRDELEALEDDTGDIDSELRDRREERNAVRNRRRTQEDAIESLEAELDDVTAELSTAESAETDASVEDLSAELDRLHRRKQGLTSTINTLSPIVEMNAKLLDGDLPDAMTSGDVVTKLDPDSRSVDCWTCGSTVDEAQITDQVETIEALVGEKRAERDEVAERIQTLTDRRRELESRADRIERLRERRDDIEAELDERRETLDALESELRELEADIEELQRAATDDPEREARLSELYDDISDLEYERGRVVTDLETVEAEIEEIESELVARGDIEAERESVAADLRERREHIETVEADLVSTFNEMMQAVLDALSYDAVERIWLERQSADHASDTAFELHVVRATGEGSVYDDTVDSLSKSEREVIGLVVALAGYLVHDVGEQVPFLVVDAVEMFDADRIDGLMDLFGEHAEYVVAAVLPEEADELAEAYETVSTETFAGKP
ncbi:archaea-specific SMC-related protein [Haloarcula onubensis]|uniref:AAA family ATPase n=1 Tax=Haloarcula onubensis TaxID=2950539 RepID=A0ABU2FJ04_9EURY|nr:archaea-specific SMC-related protein [Halomicroarcula sp. S3CR25-11]MDS0280741.1 AAA family ATPase [Halomicroarcula sp. S3CR25-11]